MLDRAERVRDPVLAAVAHQQHSGVIERRIALCTAIERVVDTRRLYDLARPGTTIDGTVSEDVQKKSIEQVVERTDLKEAPATKKVFDFALTRKIYKELQASGWKPGK